MIRRHSNWDGPDRRISEWDRRQTGWYQDDDHSVVERVVEVAAQEQKSSKFFSPSLIIPIAFTTVTAICGFIFDLYKNVTALEYKQQTVFEKITEIKQFDLELKASIKAIDDGNSKINEHISSIETTMMEMYRQKK